MLIRPIPDTPTDLLRQRAKLTPQRTAFCQRMPGGDWQSRSYQDVWEGVVRLASAFRAGGLGAKKTLAIALPSSIEWELAHQAGLLLGMTIVGVDPTTSANKLNWLLNHAGVNAIVGLHQQLATIDEEIRGQLLSVCVGPCDPSDGLIAWSDLLQQSPDAGIGATPTDPNAIATILYTSGTTGRPRGIEATNAQIMEACRGSVEALQELDETDTTMCWLPMSALFQRMANLLAISNGMPIYFVPDPRTIIDELLAVAPSSFIGVPRFFEKLQMYIQHVGWNEQLENWKQRNRILLSGSAALADPIHEFFQSHGLLILEAYGLSENTVPMAMNCLSAHRRGSVGQPLPANQIRLAEDGEILVKGAGVFRGYFRDDEVSSRFTEDGYYRSGDVGRMSDDGFLYLTGRKSEFIKTSTGRRIAPMPIESLYGQSRFLDHVVVVGDNRPFLVALASLSVPAISAYLGSNDFENAIRQPENWSRVAQMVRSETLAVEQSLAKHEKVQAWGLLSNPLSEQRGELTASWKVCRKVVEANNQSLIEALYVTGQQDVLADWQVPASELANSDR